MKKRITILPETHWQGSNHRRQRRCWKLLRKSWAWIWNLITPPLVMMPFEATGNWVARWIDQNAQQWCDIVCSRSSKHDNDPSAKVSARARFVEDAKSWPVRQSASHKIVWWVVGRIQHQTWNLKRPWYPVFQRVNRRCVFRERGRKNENATVYDTDDLFKVWSGERIAHKALGKAVQTRRKKVTSVDQSQRIGKFTFVAGSGEKRLGQYRDVQWASIRSGCSSHEAHSKPEKFWCGAYREFVCDILTDEAPQIAGSMGMLASASVGIPLVGTNLFTAVRHDITGKGIANPLALILSAVLLLDISFGMKKESETVIKPVENALKKGYRTADILQMHQPQKRRFWIRVRWVNHCERTDKSNRHRSNRTNTASFDFTTTPNYKLWQEKFKSSTTPSSDGEISAPAVSFQQNIC